MRTTVFRTALPVLLVVFALGAITASAAQASTEGPFYKIAGSRLTSGASMEVKATSKEGFEYILETHNFFIICDSQGFAGGAKILGSTGATSAGGELTFELSKCTVYEDGINCKVTEPIKSEPLTATLVYLGSGRSGALGVELKPVKGVKFGELKLSEKCNFGSVILEGDETAELYSGLKPVEVGKEPAEATTMELRVEDGPAEHVWSEKGGTLEEAKPKKLKAFGAEVALSGRSTLELAGGANWGVFT